MIHHESSDESEASADAIEQSSVDLGTDHDPSNDDDDSSSFYECLARGLDHQVGEVRKSRSDEAEVPATLSNGRWYVNTGPSFCDGQTGHPDFGYWPRSAKRLAMEAVGFFDIDSGGGSVFEGLALKKLVERVVGYGSINRGTNALCAQILNHPEVDMHPEVLPIYASYNDGMRAHGDDSIKAGLWLYHPEKQGERKSGDRWVWDPEAPLALAFVAPSKQGGDPGRHRLNLHFGGRESYFGNVVYKYHTGGASSRMDCRFVARCYQRVRLGQDATKVTPAADAAKSSVAIDKLSDTRLAANNAGVGSLSNEISMVLAAPGGNPRSSEILSELLCVLEKNDIIAKSECVRKFSLQHETASGCVNI